MGTNIINSWSIYIAKSIWINYREAKVKMIEKYLLSKGIKKTIVLKRALEGCLPVKVRRKVEDILNHEFINKK
ncbi:hypothetical protein [Clostridium intestinale]|uniref:hypothetical protein n=1 Tax=Clostridium intestinale TaxID=36845 RepID=UPI000932C20C|nr:hypothetical protein [Clostridium intestinale]